MNSTPIPAILKKAMAKRAHLQLVIHYPDGNWNGYAKDPEQLAGWIAAAERKNLPYTRPPA